MDQRGQSEVYNKCAIRPNDELKELLLPYSQLINCFRIKYGVNLYSAFSMSMLFQLTHTLRGMTSSWSPFLPFPTVNDVCVSESVGGYWEGSTSRCKWDTSDKQRPGLEKHRKQITDIRGPDSVCV